jgi:hypothetical protein
MAGRLAESLETFRCKTALKLKNYFLRKRNTPTPVENELKRSPLGAVETHINFERFSCFSGCR